MTGVSEPLAQQPQRDRRSYLHSNQNTSPAAQCSLHVTALAQLLAEMVMAAEQRFREVG